jgi:hypothetical protein
MLRNVNKCYGSCAISNPVFACYETYIINGMLRIVQTCYGMLRYVMVYATVCYGHVAARSMTSIGVA